jgi:sialic acid synthase SpsE
MGATVIEKHLTLDRTLPGPDHASSLEPAEFKQMVQAIRNVEKAMGNGIKQPCERELAVRDLYRIKGAQ